MWSVEVVGVLVLGQPRYVFDEERVLQFRGASSSFDGSFNLCHLEQDFGGHRGLGPGDIFLSRLSEDLLRGFVSPSSETSTNRVDQSY